MANLKHAVSALAAVAMVGSLAVRQASEITAVNAMSAGSIEFNQPEVLKNDSDITVLEMFTPEAVKQKEEKKEEEIKAEPEERKGYVLITEGYLNLRTAPSQEAESLAQLECASEVVILSEQDGWYLVQYSDMTGYVAKEYITESYDEANAALLEHFKYESGYINTNGVNIREAAGTEGVGIIDQADIGDLIFIIERVNDEWLKVYYGENYDLGYVLAEYVTVDDKVSKDDVAAAKVNRINDIAEDGVVSSGGAELNIRSLPDDNAEIVGKLSDGAAIRIISKGSNWTKIAVGDNGQTAYVKTEYIMDSDDIKAKAEADAAAKEAQKQASAQAESKAKTQTKTQTKSSTSQVKESTQETAKSSSSGSVSGQAIVNEAKKYIGTKYVYGGNSPSTGFDCSGLVQYVCRKVGISVSRSSRSQYGDGVAVSRSDLQPGDLVFFSQGGSISHVVIYAGGGQVIHSPRPGKTVCYASLSDICSYSNYVGARRVV